MNVLRKERKSVKNVEVVLEKICEVCKIDPATSIIRQLNVCKHCFNILSRDNQNRVKNGEDIPLNSKIIRYCYKYRCQNKTELELKFEIVKGNKTIPIWYCPLHNLKTIDL
jgi:hypothetical protein